MRQWREVVDIGNILERYEERGLARTRDDVVAQLEHTRAFRTDIDGFRDLVGQLRYADTEEEFDYALDDLYDWGDLDKRLWIGGLG
jgi:hypothetical protein